ncbi:glycosyltransferase [Chelatococcus sambhunathii]|uniref:Glycosyltransferase n=1 Tax=Chelatococcus sambhunathii TaxID=363953 RepID=A0ABU1DL09_9HYPH|nr:glycosyltransferase [Chelatococcus sambhunathii]MDR4308831.1 glycosyltransferase [Chelatococcus sambhunathii]
MILLGFAGASLAAWISIVTLRGGFWRMREIDSASDATAPDVWPAVVCVVPARDEAGVIAHTLKSLLTQDYRGDFHVVLVDDGSADGTAALARATAKALAAENRLTILSGAPPPAGWTGKLWAVSQGVERAAGMGRPKYLLLTDADIVHAPDSVSRLAARAESRGLALVSLMARLRCESFAERATIPAFVFFFQMLYPFAWVNRPAGVGAAAGGCMLVNREALAAAGGVASVRGALIDDCALGAALKRQGPVWLGLTDRAVSIRQYPRFADIAAMISRSAYAELRYQPWRLAAALGGLALVYAAPPALALFADGAARWLGVAAWAIMAVAFQPILRFYRRSPLWGLMLPAIAAFYAGCTVLSAWQHMRGRGGMWKGRAQAALGR